SSAGENPEEDSSQPGREAGANGGPDDGSGSPSSGLDETGAIGADLNDRSSGIGESEASSAHSPRNDRTGAASSDADQRRRAPGGGEAGARSLLDGLRDWTVDPELLFDEGYRDWIDRLRSIQTVLGEGDAIAKELD